ncbi:unnamed protein product [Phytomonas sp. Hart1]|nr:unnamed protein product [Phytomonas sp. Hart1]|eukprot:CCW68075.1 unnamed protein product [Phytomonas sp. isolate Hart1]
MVATEDSASSSCNSISAHTTVCNNNGNTDSMDEPKDPSRELPTRIIKGGELEKEVLERDRCLRCFFYLDHGNESPNEKEGEGESNSPLFSDSMINNNNNISTSTNINTSTIPPYLNVEVGKLRFRVGGGPHRTATLAEVIVRRMELLGMNLSSFVLMPILDNGEANACVLPCEKVEDIAAVVKTLRVVDSTTASTMVVDPFISSMNANILTTKNENGKSGFIRSTSSNEKGEVLPLSPSNMQTQRLIPDGPSQIPLQESFYGGYIPDGEGDANKAWSAIHTCISAPITALTYESSAGIISHTRLTGSSSASETHTTWDEELTSFDEENSEKSLVSSSLSSSTHLFEESMLTNDFRSMIKRVQELTPSNSEFSSEENNSDCAESDGAVGYHNETLNTADGLPSPLFYHDSTTLNQVDSETPSEGIACNPSHEFANLSNAETTYPTVCISTSRSSESSPPPFLAANDEEELLPDEFSEKNEEAPTQALHRLGGRKRSRSGDVEVHGTPPPYKVANCSYTPPSFGVRAPNPNRNMDEPTKDSMANNIVGDSTLHTTPRSISMPSSCPTTTVMTPSPISFKPEDLPPSLSSFSLGSSGFFFPMGRVSPSQSQVEVSYSMALSKTSTPEPSQPIDLTPNAGLFHSPLEPNPAPAIVVTQQPIPDYLYGFDDSITGKNPPEEENS